MTAKRYFKRMWEEEYYIFDSNTISESDFEEKLEYQNYKAFEDSMMGDEVVNRLNEQHETIQRLKQNIDELLSVDIEEKLLKENEQLKKENYELHKRLGDFEPFERHIKERTSKTSLKDIIGIVKTDEPTNSVELKKELYK